GYSDVYGPRQLAPRDWSIIKRILDGRRQFLLPGGGLKIDTRGYSENVAEAPLLAVDAPDACAGKSYVVADRYFYTLRQRVAFLADHLGHELELIDIPYAFA